MKRIILGFSFGRRGIDPGLSNEALAQAIKDLRKPSDEIVVQEEIGKALRLINVTPQHDISYHAQPGKYLDTREVARQMSNYLAKLCPMISLRIPPYLHPIEVINDLKIHVFAHPDHMKRCLKTLAKFGIIAEPINADVPYDPKSRQLWTRSRWLFRIREILASPIYLLRGEC